MEIVHAKAKYVSSHGKDLCVNDRCMKETPYDTNTPVEARECYVEGAGQLCAECYLEVYGPVLTFVAEGKEERIC